MTGDRGRKVSPPTGGRGGQASSVELWRGRFNASAKESTWCERVRRKPEGRGEANPAGAPKRMVAVGAMCEDAVMEVVCGKKIGGRHRERGKPRDAGRNETRHSAVEVQERKDK